MSYQLSSAQRRFLKGLAHPLAPVVQLGSAGITDGVVQATETALEEHELIKVRLGSSFEGERGESAQVLAEGCEAHLVQVIGRVVVLYRPRRNPKKGRDNIELP